MGIWTYSITKVNNNKHHKMYIYIYIYIYSKLNKEVHKKNEVISSFDGMSSKQFNTLG